MRDNVVLNKWKSGEVAYGAWLSLPSSISAEIVARQGFDWVCIDMQHGLIDYQAAIPMLQAISLSEATPFVRVPWNEPGIIGKVLDAGAMGVIIPMVNSVEEARAAVAACRYYPAGSRSFGPIRASYYAGSDYYERANEEVICAVMIETQQALDCLEEVLDVPGIDAVYLGPADLSITLGLPPRLDNEGLFEAARQQIAESCQRHGVVPGIHATSKLAEKHVDAGFRFITVANDVASLAGGLARDLRTVRALGSAKR